MRTLRKVPFELAPSGTHPAIITTIADLGLQRDAYAGSSRTQHKVGISYALPTKRNRTGLPFTVQDRLTLSFGERSKLYRVAKAALRKDPEELDLAELLGKSLLIEVIHRESGDRTWANVGEVTALPEEIALPKVPLTLHFFDLDAPDEDVFARLPALFRSMIERRVKEEVRDPVAAGPDFDDDIPF